MGRSGSLKVIGRLEDLFPVLTNEDAAFLLAEQDRDGLEATVGFLDRFGRKLADRDRILPGLNRGEGCRRLRGLAALRLVERRVRVIDFGQRGGASARCRGNGGSRRGLGCRIGGWSGLCCDRCGAGLALNRLGRGRRGRGRDGGRGLRIERGKLCFRGLEVRFRLIDVVDGLARLGSCGLSRG